MSEENRAVFSIEKVYLKDLSLEIPNAPQVFLESEAPQIDINLHNEARALDAGLYEVVLTATVTARAKDRTAFLVEAAQAGIFQIRNVAQQELEALLGITCGDILFPYLRETVSSVVARGGFPPFFLNPVRFEDLYRQHVERQREQQRQAGAPPPAS
jgi:preprotein translocase subunit SecB